MAKFGWNEEALFYVSDVSMQDNVADPGAPSAEEGSLRLYSSDAAGSQRLYIRDSVEAIMIPINAVDAPNVTGQSLIQGKNTDGELEFYGIKSADGHLDIALVDDDIVLTVDLSDINDELDHGLLQGLSDDDHAQYLLLAGRSGGQVAKGGTDASDDLELQSTSNATKGEVKIIDESDLRVNDRIFRHAIGNTTDLSENADVFTIPLVEGKRYYFKATVTAMSDDEVQFAMFEQSQGAYRKTAGAAVLQGNQNSQHKTRTDGLMKVDFIASTNDIVVRCGQGAMTENIQWECWLEVFEA